MSGQTNSASPPCPLCADLKTPLVVHERGQALLSDARLNKGAAFTIEERQALGIDGLLPPRVVTLAEQLERVYQNFSSRADALGQYIYLRSLQDRNETLFYAAMLEHLAEFMPIVYTPTVAQGVENFSQLFRSTRGVYLSPDNIDQVDSILANAPCHDVSVIVATDNEGILGIGDMGVGGMAISIGKLALYTSAGGICPSRCLPVCLDVGTANKSLLDDPLYLGYRGPRLQDDEYYPFLDKFVAAVKRHLPQAILQWEDFSRDRAFSVLHRYEHEVASFNDDVQGTAAMVYAATLGALRITGQKFSDLSFVVSGAGAAGIGIAESTVQALKRAGLSEQEALDRIYMLDSRGLLVADRPGLDDYKRPYACRPEQVAEWKLQGDRITLYDTVVNAHPTVIYGLSGHPGTIDEASVRAMADYCARPIILPMSNPSSLTDAHPGDLIRWTDGRVIVATGSPFEPVEYDGKTFNISQANNVMIFPGVGAGAHLAGTREVSADMLARGGEALHGVLSAADTAAGRVLPPNQGLREISARVAAAVAEEAWNSGLAGNPRPAGDLIDIVRQTMWVPGYRRYVAG